MTPMRNLKAADLFTDSELRIIVGISPHDNPRDVDEAYGAGTYDRLFPEPDEEESDGPDPYDEGAGCDEYQTAVETELEKDRTPGQ